VNIFYHTWGSQDPSQPVAWRYGIRCSHCSHLMAQATSSGTDRPASAPLGLLRIRCAMCSHEQSYDAGWAAPLIAHG
jgi:hypothetical protein